MAKLTDKCSVYHIALPGWPESAGYIGIAADPEQRWKQHERDAHAKMSPLEVHHQMREHKGEYVKEVIFEGTREECLELEFELRSEWNMGWNTRPGGEWDERHWRPNPNWVSTKLIHAEYGLAEINKDLGVWDFCKKYKVGSKGSRGDYTGSTGNIGYVLAGNLPHFHGWRLADPILAERVYQKCTAPLELRYLTKEGEYCKVHPSGMKEFRRYIGERETGSAYGMVARGLRKKILGWELCTEEEYLANPGPVFGTPEK